MTNDSIPQYRRGRWALATTMLAVALWAVAFISDARVEVADVNGDRSIHWARIDQRAGDLMTVGRTAVNDTFTCPGILYRSVAFPGWAGRFLQIDYWVFLMPIAVIAAAIAWAGHRRRRRALHRLRAGRCTACGYDLSASPTRCPECGTVPQQ